MGKILEFPGKPDDFSCAEKGIREFYGKAGIPEDVISEAVVEYRPIHEHLFAKEALGVISIPPEIGVTDEQAEAIIALARETFLPKLGGAARTITDLIVRQLMDQRERG